VVFLYMYIWSYLPPLLLFLILCSPNYLFFNFITNLHMSFIMTFSYIYVYKYENAHKYIIIYIKHFGHVLPTSPTLPLLSLCWFPLFMSFFLNSSLEMWAFILCSFYFILFFTVVLGGVHCGIYKTSYTISNISCPFFRWRLHILEKRHDICFSEFGLSHLTWLSLVLSILLQMS
jgi:hypothetical protein